MSRIRYSLSIIAARSMLYGTMFIGILGLIGVLTGYDRLSSWHSTGAQMALPTSIVVIIHSIVGLILTRSPEVKEAGDMEVLREELRHQ